MEYRVERDSLGEVQVPVGALYGAQTQRAILNFGISGITFPSIFIKALGLIKDAAAEVNVGLGLLNAETAQAIREAAVEVSSGILDRHFPLDIFQTGSGTSTNMNVNEVIANRATQILGGEAGSKMVHPNDHVNLGQSSNDVIPTAIHVASYVQLHDLLLPALRHLHETIQKRIPEFDTVVKFGRTHLMDAVPIRLSQEISGWAYQVSQSIERIEFCLPRLAKLAIGGTAVGTGINTHSEFGRRVARELAARTGLPFVETENHFAAQAAMDTVTELSGHLRTTAVALMKICNDLRLMNSGPIAGLGEISIPELQAGSSIMPGKTNPVICEATMMVCAQVVGNDTAVTIGSQSGSFELNTMLPLIAHNILQSIAILANSVRSLSDKVIAGLTVNAKHISRIIELNPILVTALNPIIGYEKGAQIAKKAYAEKRPIKEIAAEMTNLTKEELDSLLDPMTLTKGGNVTYHNRTKHIP